MTFRMGQRVKLTPELGGAEVSVIERCDLGPNAMYMPRVGYRVSMDTGAEFTISANMLREIAIEWRPGDVVVVNYGPNPGQGMYTYVRGAETWPVDKGRTPKTDEWMNRMYAQGKVTPVLQAGGAKFDTARLPAGPPKVQPFAQGGIVAAPRAGSFVWHNDGQMP